MDNKEKIVIWSIGAHFCVKDFGCGFYYGFKKMNELLGIKLRIAAT